MQCTRRCPLCAKSGQNLISKSNTQTISKSHRLKIRTGALLHAPVLYLSGLFIQRLELTDPVICAQIGKGQIRSKEVIIRLLLTGEVGGYAGAATLYPAASAGFGLL